MSADIEWRRVKANLTRAENSGDGDRIWRAIRDARETFEKWGYPDWWARVDRLEADTFLRCGQ